MGGEVDDGDATLTGTIDNYARWRTIRGPTQERLAERAGVSAKAVCSLENDVTRTPRLETITRLADALSLDREERACLLDMARPASPAPATPEAGEQPRSAQARPPQPPL